MTVIDELDERAPSEGLHLLPRGKKAQGRRLIVVSGAKGGAGKSLVASNLALYLATIGRKVIVVDADAAGANLHTFLGVRRPGALAPYQAPMVSFGASETTTLAGQYLDPLFDAPLGVASESASHGREEDIEETTQFGGPIDVAIPGLKLIHAGIDEPIVGQRRRTSSARLLKQLRSLDADFVVVDLGSGTQRSLLDIYLAADLGVYVTLPEPTASENCYRFIRALFARYLTTTAATPADRRLVVEELRALGGTPAPLDLLRALERKASPLVRRVREAMGELTLRLVVNQTRLRSDLELGEWIRSAAKRRLGVGIEYLGYIDYDDTVWTCVRSRRPLLVESPGTKASKSLEKVARRLLALDAGKLNLRPTRTVPPDTLHDLLEVDRGATDEEVRRAHKRAKEVYAPDSLAVYGLFDPLGLEELRARIEEAYDVLLDPARRRPYELSVFSVVEEIVESPEEEEREEERPQAPTVLPETEFTGRLLRALRESQGRDLKTISETTKIGLGYLQAIEADEFRSLPAMVYVRGFVGEFAKCLGVDAEQASRTYVRRYERYLREREKH